MSTQLLPLLLQRVHCRAYEVGLFDQLPVDPDSVWPTCAVPETAGNAVLAGTAGGGAVTMVVWVESVGVLGPAVLVAVTRIRRVEPVSAAWRV